MERFLGSISRFQYLGEVPPKCILFTSKSGDSDTRSDDWDPTPSRYHHHLPHPSTPWAGLNSSFPTLGSVPGMFLSDFSLIELEVDHMSQDNGKIGAFV